MSEESPLVTLPAARADQEVHKIHPSHVRRISSFSGKEKNTFPVSRDETMTTPEYEEGSVVVLQEKAGRSGGYGNYKEGEERDVGEVKFRRIHVSLPPEEVENRLYE